MTTADRNPPEREQTRTMSRDHPRAWTQNARGEWVPAIPLPLFGLRKRCECGRKFWRLRAYHAHYALMHIQEGR